jgi:hypothetical protein
MFNPPFRYPANNGYDGTGRTGRILNLLHLVLHGLLDLPVLYRAQPPHGISTSLLRLHSCGK